MGAFLLLHLIAILVLIAVPFLYLLAGWMTGRHLFRIKGVLYLGIYAVVWAALPAIWLGRSYYLFRAGCNQADGTDFVRPVKDVEGFYLGPYVFERTGMRIGDGISRAPFNLVNRGVYKYVEYGGSPYFYRYDRQTKSHLPLRNGKRTSRYEFEVTSPKPVSALSMPYYKIGKIRIVDGANGKVVAQVTEKLFGGGLMGQYFKYLGDWSNNNLYQACGYAGKSPHYYRPGTRTDKAVEVLDRYFLADSQFIQSALVPVGGTK